MSGDGNDVNLYLAERVRDLFSLLYNSIYLPVPFQKMFGTLRYCSQQDHSEFIGRASDPASLGPSRSLACDRCRSKKVASSPSIHCCALSNIFACLYSRDVVVKGKAVIGVNVIQAPAPMLRGVDVARLPMHRARAIA